LKEFIVDKKQHIYEMIVVKREYHYMKVKASSMDEAEELVIELILDNPDESVLEQYWDDSECEVMGLGVVRKPYEGIETIN
jgi:tRNA A22 N-methylase